MSRRIRVATVITRLAAGAGGVALRGALALDPEVYDLTMIAGGAGLDGALGYRCGTGLLTGAAATRDAPTGDLLANAAAAGLAVGRLPELVPQLSPGLDRGALRMLTGYLADGRFDVVHTHSAKAGALGRLAADRAGVPRIVHTYHGFPFHSEQSWPRRTAYLELERWLGRRTDAILAVGPAVAAETARLGLISPERICTIAPAVDPPAAVATVAGRAAARRALGLAPGIRAVGTIGRVDYQKAPEQWVDALAEIAGDDVCGVWIGDGPYTPRLLGRVRRRGLTDRFLFLGHRPDATRLLPAFDVFLLASRYEGLPCVLAEAMQAGVPVVATAVNSVPDLVVPGVTGMLVPPNQPRLLARAAAYLLDQPQVAHRLAENAYASLGSRFTAGALATLLDQTYRATPGRRTTAARPEPQPRRSVQWT
ncbi:MAG TPA: glycosyltransferase [Jatrophihabitans sp.]|nr:glycosyltransferase [Jatrophihabitans sp.]